jgi:NAD-dependent DNA ligase
VVKKVAKKKVAEKKVAGGKLAGQTFVITGTLKGYERADRLLRC